MSNSKAEYDLISSKLLEKITPLYELCPWDDLYNDTKHGSRELDNLVADALCFGTTEEKNVIRSYNEALYAESKIKISDCQSEERWREKIKAAQLLLERIEPFVDAVLAYYERTKK